MNDPDADAADALDAYLAALERGETPDRSALLARHPALASAVAGCDAIRQALPPESGPDVTRVNLASPTPSDAVGAEFGAFVLERELGRGGMGVVYLARERGLERRVALKLVLHGPLASAEHRARFGAEARAIARVQHPNIVSLFQAGEQHGQPYLAMRYVPGPSLAKVLAQGRMPFDQAARIALAVARAVEHLHQHGIVHRDLKPSNILLDADGQPCVTDFGLAKLLGDDQGQTQSGAVVGTPSYMAPEQASGKSRNVGPASDVYALGAVLFEMLTGRPPFAEATALDTLVQVLEGEPPTPRSLRADVPRDLERICLHCLEKASESRYPSAAALAADLERWQAGEPVEAAEPTFVAQAVRWARREPALAAHWAMLAACLLLAQLAFHLGGPTPLQTHLQVQGLLAGWAAACWFCQTALSLPPMTERARFLWSAVDVGFFSAIAHVSGSVHTPSAIGFPLLVGCSGLWFRESVVWATTAGSALSYLTLLALGGEAESLHRDLMFVFGLVVLGYATASQVQRVRALSRHYDRRPLP